MDTDLIARVRAEDHRRRADQRRATRWAVARAPLRQQVGRLLVTAGLRLQARGPDRPRPRLGHAA